MSLVFHSGHPFVPTLRADVRRFEVDGREWYGGGCDLTPFYLYEDDVAEFHGYWKRTCEAHDAQLYPEFKEWCDRYFYLPARKEHRGVGGLFFDDLDAAEASYDVEEVCPG
jgi:coproporphyrinogen III oxidase